MLVANLAALALVHMPTLAALILQEQPVGWDPISLWRQMGVLAKIVVGILFIMSGWSIGVMIDRALERTEAIVHAELKRGLGGLATIGSTAPFVGLFGTVVGILNAFKGISQEKATGLAAVAGGIAEALVTTAVGLFVAIPAVMMFNYLTGRVEAFDVEMDNSSSELIDYFLKRRGMRRS